MYKLGLEKAEEREFKLPTFVGAWRKQENFRKNIYFSSVDYTKAFDYVEHNKLWKFLEEMGILDHLTCLLRNLYAVKKQRLEPYMEQQTGSELGRQFQKAVYFHPVHLIYMQTTSCEMLGWMNHKLESRLLGRITISDKQIIPL